MEEAFIALLLADSSLDAQVGNRIYWARRPQEIPAMPAIVLFRITGDRDNHMTAASGLVFSRVQCDCYGETYASAKQTARALRDIVNGYNASSGGTDFQGIFIDSERDTNETEADGRHLFRTSIDLDIWHDE